MINIIVDGSFTAMEVESKDELIKVQFILRNGEFLEKERAFDAKKPEDVFDEFLKTLTLSKKNVQTLVTEKAIAIHCEGGRVSKNHLIALSNCLAETKLFGKISFTFSNVNETLLEDYLKMVANSYWSSPDDALVDEIGYYHDQKKHEIYFKTKMASTIELLPEEKRSMWENIVKGARAMYEAAEDAYPTIMWELTNIAFWKPREHYAFRIFKNFNLEKYEKCRHKFTCHRLNEYFLDISNIVSLQCDNEISLEEIESICKNILEKTFKKNECPTDQAGKIIDRYFNSSSDCEMTDAPGCSSR